MKKLLCLLLIGLMFFSCSLFEDDEDEVVKNGPVELVSTDDAEYPVMGFEEDGTSYLFNEDLSSVYLRTGTGDEWSLHIDPSTGNPIDLFMLTAKGDYYVVFSAFNGDRADVAISKINSISHASGSGISVVESETQHLLGVEFEGMSQAQSIVRTKSAGTAFDDDWEEFFVSNIKRTVGHVTAAVGCGLGLAGAGVTFAGSAGTATPFSIVMASYACGSFASGLAGDITGVKPFSDLSKGLAINGTTVDCAKALATRSSSDVASCVNDLVGLASGIETDSEELKQAIGAQISADLAAFKRSGGLIGKWISNEDAETVTQSEGGISVTSTINPPSLEFATSICNLVLSGSSKMSGPGIDQTIDFKYAFKYQFTLTDEVEFDEEEKGYFCFATFQIQGVTMYANGSSTFISWNEFKNVYASAGVGLPAGMSDMESFNSYYGIFPETNSLVIDLFNGEDAIFYKE